MIGSKSNGIPVQILRCLRRCDNNVRGLRTVIYASNSAVSNALVQLVRAGNVAIVDETVMRDRMYRFVCMPDPAAVSAPTRRELEGRYAKRKDQRAPENVTPAPYRRGLSNWGGRV